MAAVAAAAPRLLPLFLGLLSMEQSSSSYIRVEKCSKDPEERRTEGLSSGDANGGRGEVRIASAHKANSHMCKSGGEVALVAQGCGGWWTQSGAHIRMANGLHSAWGWRGTGFLSGGKIRGGERS